MSWLGVEDMSCPGIDEWSWPGMDDMSCPGVAEDAGAADAAGAGGTPVAGCALIRTGTADSIAAANADRKFILFIDVHLNRLNE